MLFGFDITDKQYVKVLDSKRTYIAYSNFDDDEFENQLTSLGISFTYGELENINYNDLFVVYLLDNINLLTISPKDINILKLVSTMDEKYRSYDKPSFYILGGGD